MYEYTTNSYLFGFRHLSLPKFGLGITRSSPLFLVVFLFVRNTGHILRNDDDYLLPHPREEFFKKIPIYSLAAAWNAAGLLRFYL
jgi:hypothetical protein